MISFRSYIKHAKECFIKYPNTLKLVEKKLGCASFFNSLLRVETLFLVFDKLHEEDIEVYLPLHACVKFVGTFSKRPFPSCFMSRYQSEAWHPHNLSFVKWSDIAATLRCKGTLRCCVTMKCWTMFLIYILLFQPSFILTPNLYMGRDYLILKLWSRVHTSYKQCSRTESKHFV